MVTGRVHANFIRGFASQHGVVGMGFALGDQPRHDSFQCWDPSCYSKYIECCHDIELRTPAHKTDVCSTRVLPHCNAS